jgi:hypothetical protein
MMSGSELKITLLRALFLVVVIIGISGIPVFLVQYLPLVDYPLNLARIHILQTWSASPFLQDIYTIQSFMLPNAALDIISVLLADVINPEITAKISIFLIMTTIVTGVGALHYSLFRKFTFWPLLFSGFLLYNYIFFLGFLNYLLGTGLMLWCLALWILLESRPLYWRIIFGIVSTLILFYSHLIAFGLYGIAVTAYGVQRSFAAGRFEKNRLLRAASVTFVSFIPALIIYFGVSSTSSDLRQGFSYQSFSGKLLSFLFTPTSLNPRMDIIVAVCVLLLLVMTFYRGKVRIARDSILILGSFMMAFLVLPVGTAHGYHLDDRIPLALLLVFSASVSISIPDVLFRRILVLISVMLFVVRVGVVSKDWIEWDKQYTEYIHILDQVRPNSALLVATETHVADHHQYPYNWMTPPLLHLAELAAVRKDIFLPAVYADPVTHTIRVTKEYEDIYELQDNDPVVVNNSGELQTLVNDVIKYNMQMDAIYDSVYLLVFRTPVKSVKNWDIENADIMESTQQLVLMRMHTD